MTSNPFEIGTFFKSRLQSDCSETIKSSCLIQVFSTGFWDVFPFPFCSLVINACFPFLWRLMNWYLVTEINFLRMDRWVCCFTPFLKGKEKNSNKTVDSTLIILWILHLLDEIYSVSVHRALNFVSHVLFKICFIPGVPYW